MKYFEPTGPALRLAVVFILACGTQVAWAQEAAGGQLRYSPEIDRIPTSRSLFDVLTVQPDFPTERQDPQTDETDPYGSFYDRPITHDLDRLDPYLERNAGPGIQHVPSGLYVNGGWNDPRDRAPDNFGGQRDPFGLHGQPDNRDPVPEFNDAQAQDDPQFELRYDFSERLTLGLRYDREATDSAPPCPYDDGFSFDIEAPSLQCEDQPADTSPTRERLSIWDTSSCCPEDRYAARYPGPRDGPQYEYTDIGEPWDSLARVMRAQDERRSAERELDDAARDNLIYWVLDPAGIGPDWREAEHASHRVDRAEEAVDATIAEEETARTANAHAQAEFERWEADQPERVYPPYEGQPRYIELPPTESTFPSVADLDRAEEDDLRETYYETLRRHADGDGTTIEDVEAAYRALHGRLPPR